jgi:hypothetical protein
MRWTKVGRWGFLRAGRTDYESLDAVVRKDGRRAHRRRRDNPTWLVVDYDDWPRDDFDNFVNFLVLNDEARSWRWFAHRGCSLRANEHTSDDPDFPGERTRTLNGRALMEPGAGRAVDLAGRAEQ